LPAHGALLAVHNYTERRRSMKITVEPLAAGDLKPFPETLAFGKHFTSRMFSERYTPDQGWHDARIGPYRPLVLDPSTAVLHYAQEFFEGLKAYRRPDGDVNLFRPWENMARFNRSAQRMAMPQVDPEEHLEALVELIALEHEWVPRQEGASLYIRPTMIATDASLGVHASHDYLHFIILSPVGAYFNSGFNPVAVYICRDYVRAVPGGTGDVKAGGNYAASLLVAEEVARQGYQQVLWLDAVEHRYVEEVGAMNIAFVYGGKHIATPALSGSILPGITRDSVLKLAPDLGYTVSEERIDVNRMLEDGRSGRISEIFAMGTAAVIAPIGRFGFETGELVINNGEAGPVAQHLFKALTDIQYGRVPDAYGWTQVVKPGK
jgi:branched-chain amino acid aminotransferase